ncbi:unannotated protein [freshwater metagenome]|uniref:Unannotated protein n=1 Tax=freshwater metagenome TaxID=449393 RepID=A0A6J6MZX4_9ZZZZ
MTFIVSLVALAIAAFVLVAVLGLISIFLGAGASRPATRAEMNEGDFHSGPEGYTPNTAYPDTYYGSAGQNDRDEEDSRN